MMQGAGVIVPPLSPPAPSRQAQSLLKDQLEVVRMKQPDGSTRFAIKPLDAEFSFDKGFFMFIRAIQLLTQHNKDTILVRARAAASQPVQLPRRRPATFLPLQAAPPGLAATVAAHPACRQAARTALQEEHSGSAELQLQLCTSLTAANCCLQQRRHPPAHPALSTAVAHGSLAAAHH